MRTDHLADPPHCGGGLRYADQLVKGLLYRFRRAAATRVGIPWLRFIVRNWIFGDPLNAYSQPLRVCMCLNFLHPSEGKCL